jgi:hypothetical protein
MESAFDGVYRNEINQRNTAATLLLKTGYHTSDFFQEFGIEIEFRNENDMTTNVARTIWSGDQEYRKISDYSLVYHHESPFFTNTILSAYYGLNIRSSLSMSNDYRYPELFKAHRYFKKEGSIHTNLEIPLLLNVSAGKHTDFFLFYKFYFNHYYTSNDTRTEQHLSSGSNRTRFGIKVKQHNYELVGSLENINVASAELRKYF